MCGGIYGGMCGGLVMNGLIGSFGDMGGGCVMKGVRMKSSKYDFIH